MLININGNKFNVKTVLSSKDIQKGMMGRKFNNEYNGMFFMLNEGQHCFWMKNCDISLDIIYIQDDKIVKIFHNCEPCLEDDCKNYCSEGNYVLEVKGGTCKKLGISEGDSILY